MSTLFETITHGSRVTITTPHGGRVTGRATIHNRPAGLWVLNLGGRHGTPGIADPSNVVAVKAPRAGKTGGFTV